MRRDQLDCWQGPEPPRPWHTEPRGFQPARGALRSPVGQRSLKLQQGSALRRAQEGTCTMGIITPRGRHSPSLLGTGSRDEELLRNLYENDL